MLKPIVKLENVTKEYKMGDVTVTALKNINLEIKKGDFVAIIGASGSGKSTMMNIIGCLDTPTKGKVFLDSHDISALKESMLSELRGKTIGFVFQQYNLIQNMTAFENVLLPLEFLEVDENTAKKRAKEILCLVGLNEKMNSRPTQLSGGQQQRVSIARSLVANPDIILADEPTGALDSVTGKELLTMLTKLHNENGKTIIMVTHDLNLAKYARTIVTLKDGLIISISENKEERVKHEN